MQKKKKKKTKKDIYSKNNSSQHGDGICFGTICKGWTNMAARAELESATTYEKQFRSWPNVQLLSQLILDFLHGENGFKRTSNIRRWQDIQRRRKWLLTCYKGYSKAKSKLPDFGSELQDNQTICQRDITLETDGKTRFVPLENCTKRSTREKKTKIMLLTIQLIYMKEL